MSIVSGDTQVKPGWYQDPNNPDIYRSYIKSSKVGSVGIGDYIYEFNTRTGSSNILTSGLNRQLIWQVNGSTSYRPVNVNSDLIKNLKADGLDVTALQNVDKSYASWAKQNIPLTNSQQENLNALGRFNTAGRAAPPSGRPPGSPDDGSNPANPGEGGAGSVASAVKFSENTSQFGTNQEYKPETLVYPSNYNTNQDTLQITQFKYVTADVFGGELDASNTGKILDGTDLRARTFTKSFGIVILPMPNNISESNETGWGSNELSTLTAAALGASIKGVASITDFDLPGLVGGLSNLGGIRGTAASKTILDLATLRAGAGVVSKFGLNVDPAAYLSRATGTVVNPNLELLFTGPKLRSFNYQIKMSPRNNNDAKNIRSIIKFFKKGMAPQRSSTNSTGFFLGAPNVFQIKFKSANSEIKSLGQIRMCALTNFNVDYTPDGNYAAFNDPIAGGSQPVSTNITLTFTELTPIYEDDYGADDHTGFGDTYDPSKPELVGGATPQNQNPSGREPSRGGTSGAAAEPTRVLQQGGSTATPGVDTPAPFSGRPGTEPRFTGGVRGI